MTLNELCEKAYGNAEAKGFWKNFGHDSYVAGVSMRLMLIVSELGEAVEALRHDDEDMFREELADVVIRLGDLCGGLGINLEAEVARKMQKNEERPYLHGKGF